MNRTPAIHTLEVALDSPCIQGDLAVIRYTLLDLDLTLDLDHARAVLAVGLRNKPDAWTVTMEELEEMWAE